MSRKPLAEAHRRLGKAEHGVERRMLDQADVLPDPDTVRHRARDLSANAQKHLDHADRLDDDVPT